MQFILILVGWVLFWEALILILSRNRKPQAVTHILVLGAHDGETTNRERTQMALEAKALYPEAKLIVSGNEKDRGEVSMLLKHLGELADTAICEEQSTTTWENLAFSRAHLDADSNVLIVTSDFHRSRALATARVLGVQASVLTPQMMEHPKLGWWTRERMAVAIFFFGILIFVGRRLFRR